MNTEQLRELDMWIGINVFGMKAIHRDGPRPTKGTEDDYFVIEWIHHSQSLPLYHRDPAAALRVLERCAEKLGPDQNGIEIFRNKSDWAICALYRDGFGHEESDGVCSKTLPLAICLFAQKLFSTK